MLRMSVFRRSGRKFFECQWVDPVTGKLKTRSTKTATQREAERFAAKLANELESGKAVDLSKVTWQEIRDRYSEEVLSGLALRSRRKDQTTFSAVEKHLNPHKAASITAATLSRFAVKLREAGLRPYTVRGHLSVLRKVLRWAHRQGLVASVPAVEFPPATGMKGRPITPEEFDRMLGKVASVVGQDKANSWQFLLRGLWLSGLRLEEAMHVRWTDDRDLMVDLSGKRPMLRIRAHAQKSRTDTVTPLTPDFAELLLSVPENQRKGFVFNPQPEGRRRGGRPSAEWVGKIISRIGEAALVKVSERFDDAGESIVKWASAHDLRRSFGARWASRVMPAVLQQMMRHASIQTTMGFYVGRQAETAADAIWEASTNISANSPHETPLLPKRKPNANRSGD